MSELIKITTNNEGIQLVSARELHEGLEVGRDFTTWIKNRINKYGFEENEDYTIVNLAHQNGGASWGGNNRVDYIITTDMAKELCMVENNEQGRKYRKYFIECEKKLKQLDIPSYMIDDPIKRAEKWIIEQKQTQALAEKVQELQPKADYCDDVLASDELLTSTQIAKEFGMTAFRFNQLMNELGVIYKQGKTWVVYKKYEDKGLVKNYTTIKCGNSITYLKWTQAGRNFVHKLLAENNIYPIC